MTDDRDDLYSPTLTDVHRRRADLPQPWRLGSQLYVAFLGGPLAAATVGYLNGKRLGLPRERLLAIAALGVLGLLLVVVAIAVTGADNRARFISNVSGVLTFLGARQLQGDADRVYRAQAADENEAFASLWGPGLLIVLASSLVTAAIVIPVALAA